MLKDRECGITVDSHDPQAIADAIEWLLTNSRAAREMGARAQSIVEKEFSWRNEAITLLELYKKL
jgi:glycosyltransferase involved in cell wall biosynthesis